MNPTRDRLYREDLPARRITCRHYSECLNEALSRGWSGFSCRECQSFEADRLGPEESMAEIAGCCALQWAVEHPAEWQWAHYGG